ncbi:hypothetical protein D3C86_1941610 [compost metagenome]
MQVDGTVEGAVLDALAPVRLHHLEELFQLLARDGRIRHRHQAFGLAQQQGTVLVDQDVAEAEPGIEQMQDLLDQGAEDRMVFVFFIAEGADLRRLVIVHRTLLSG